METTNKIFKMKYIFGVLFCGILMSACTSVYFKKPVPQNGNALAEIPAGWAGVYVEEPEQRDETSIYRHCIRLERLGATRLLVTEETRIHASDIPKLKQELDEMKSVGKLNEYLLTDRFLMTLEPVNDTTRPGITAERRITQLFRQNQWYILAASAKPTMLFDLETATVAGFDVQEHTGGNSAVIPDSDSLSTSSMRLVALQKDNGYYLNQLAQDEGSLWELYYVVQPSPNELVLKTSVLKNKERFEKRLKQYNAITPFAQSNDGNAYIIDPTDAALEQLLADDELFHVTRMRKIENE